MNKRKKTIKEIGELTDIYKRLLGCFNEGAFEKAAENKTRANRTTILLMKSIKTAIDGLLLRLK